MVVRHQFYKHTYRYTIHFAIEVSANQNKAALQCESNNMSKFCLNDTVFLVPFTALCH